MTEHQIPLSAREGWRELETHVDGVPAWLEEPLWAWIDRFFTEVPIEYALLMAEKLGVELRLPMQSRYQNSPVIRVRDAVGRDQERMLDVVDWLLETCPRLPAAALERAPRHLGMLLAGGGSRWRVSSDRTRLEERVDPTVVAETDKAIAAAADSAPTAGEHLRAAWVSLYGRGPDYGNAIAEAILAVEAAAKPLVLGEPFGTLGGVLRQLDRDGRWELVMPLQWGRDQRITDAGSVLAAMVKIVWHGQGERHGSPTSATPKTPEQAETVVTAAVALVHLFTAGLVRPAAGPS